MGEELFGNKTPYNQDSNYYLPLDLSWLNKGLENVDAWKRQQAESGVVDNGKFNINKAIGSGLGFINGVTGIVNTVQGATKINENQEFNNRYNELKGYTSRDYDTFDQMAQASNRINAGISQDYNTVRGITGTGQRASVIGSAGLYGLQAGHSIGKNFGLVGDLIASGVGLFAGTGAGIFGLRRGDINAEAQVAFDNTKGNMAQRGALSTLGSEHEDLVNYNHRGLATHVVARGGDIQRGLIEQENIQDFANRVLGKKNSILPKRTLCKGGVMVKVKMK